MKLKAYHIYFIAIFIGGLIGVFIDLNYTYQSTEYPELNGVFGLGYGMGMVFSYGGIILLCYYVIVYFYKRFKQKSKSYI